MRRPPVRLPKVYVCLILKGKKAIEEYIAAQFNSNLRFMIGHKLTGIQPITKPTDQVFTL